MNLLCLLLRAKSRAAAPLLAVGVCLLAAACGSAAPAQPSATAPNPTPTRLPGTPTSGAPASSAPTGTAIAPTSSATARATATPVPNTQTPTAAPAASATRPAAAATSRPAASAQPAGGFNPAVTTIRLDRVLGGLAAPVDAKAANDGTERLFIVEKAGTIRIVRNGALQAETFLDIRSIVRATESERGLLGLAFHPKYKSNGQFYVYYTESTGDIIIARYNVTSNPERADPNSRQEILRVAHRQASNHNGGGLDFGPDGYLYIGTGDGGGGGDSFGNSQKPDALLAKLLRLDVDGGTPYAIPKGNPFVDRAGYRPEVWAWGLRNPWRFSFDRVTGDLYIGDVGQGRWEEVNFQPANSTGGENYGWNKMEGAHCFPLSIQTCSTTGFVLPIGEYEHLKSDCSITGGYVYRGSAQPALKGAYVFADYCTGHVFSLVRGADNQWVQTDHLTTGFTISSFGEDERGEVYALSIGNGNIYRVSAAPK